MFSLKLIVIISTLVCLAHSEGSNLCQGRNNYQRLTPDPQDSHKFHVCKDGVEVGVQSCAYGTVFSDTYQTCVHEINNRDIRCAWYRMPYANPLNRHTFIVCVQGRALVFTCPANLVFNNRAQVCVWDYQDH